MATPSAPNFTINDGNLQENIASMGWGGKSNVEGADGSSVSSWQWQTSFPGPLSLVPPVILQALSRGTTHGLPLPFQCQGGCRPYTSPWHPASLCLAAFVFDELCPISSPNHASLLHWMVSLMSNLMKFLHKNCQDCSWTSVSPQKLEQLWYRSQMK